MNKTLVVVQNINLYFWKFLRQKSFDLIDSENNLTSVNIIDWKHKLKQYTRIIIFDSAYREDIGDLFINNCNKSTELFLFYWNSIRYRPKRLLKLHKIRKNYILSTYDRYDSFLLNMKYMGTFYDKTIMLDIKTKKYDLFFCGRIKNRSRLINRYYKIFHDLDIQCYFYIYDEEKCDQLPINTYHEYLNYSEYLDIVAQTTALLDLNMSTKNGLSMRVMEAIFLNKKLITNNRNVLDESFYNPKNIFVLGIDKIDKLKEFLLSDVAKIDQKLLENYDINKWVKRFE